jgi:tetratricopeptide (TPR) repeat protein
MSLLVVFEGILSLRTIQLPKPSMPTANAIKQRKKPRPALKRVQQRLPILLNTTTPHPAFTSLLKLRIAPALLLTLLTFAVYYQVIHHPFSNYDDGEYVGDNLKIQQGITGGTLRWALTSIEHANWHPLTWLSHALDWQLYGSNPSGHHVTSLLLHTLNVVLLFFFLARVTRSTSRSFLVAALFAVHPLNVESVAWIAERKNVLCALFFLLTLLAYAGYARRPSFVRYLIVASSFALALSAKSMVVTLPFVLLLLDFWPLQRIEGWSRPSTAFPAPQFSAWKIAVEKLPLLALSVAASVITFIAQQKDGSVGSVAKFPLSLRFANAIVSYAAYLWKAVWPANLAVLYPYPSKGLPFWQVLLSALLLAALSAWTWRERSRRSYLIAGWCWFLGTLVPVIGLIQVGDQAMADRYAYLPLIGIFVMVVWGFSDLLQHAGGALSRSASVAAAVALLLLSTLAWRQARLWRSNLELWSHAAAVTTNNGAAEDVIGSLLLVDAMNAGIHYSDEAQVHFQKALAINPKDSAALSDIGGNLQGHGRPQQALEKLQLALQYAQQVGLKSKILGQMASAYEQLGDFTTARQYYRDALKISPSADGAAFVGFARTFTDEKIAKLTADLAVRPTAQGYLQLGQMQQGAGYADAAHTSYQQALLLDPRSEPARAALEHAPNSKP